MTSLVLTDYNKNGLNELIVGSEDFEIRVGSFIDCPIFTFIATIVNKLMYRALTALFRNSPHLPSHLIRVSSGLLDVLISYKLICRQ